MTVFFGPSRIHISLRILLLRFLRFPGRLFAAFRKQVHGNIRLHSVQGPQDSRYYCSPTSIPGASTYIIVPNIQNHYQVSTCCLWNNANSVSQPASIPWRLVCYICIAAYYCWAATVHSRDSGQRVQNISCNISRTKNRTSFHDHMNPSFLKTWKLLFLFSIKARRPSFEEYIEWRNHGKLYHYSCVA